MCEQLLHHRHIKAFMTSKYHSKLRPVWALCIASALAACAIDPPPPAPPAPAAAPTAPTRPPEPAPAPAATPAAPKPSPGAAALQMGVTSFNSGEYKRAESKLLESQKLGLNQTSEQVQAHKTKAFLYCVTQRSAQCEKSFREAFDADKSFDLSRAERGHPVWGPVFSKVQKTKVK